MTEALPIARQITDAFKNGNKLLIFGNGGSAAEAQHMAAELVCQFEIPGRRPLPAIALTTDSSALTAWANDQGFSDVFSRQLEALGRPGDVALGISTSGKSANVVNALTLAQDLGLTAIDLPRQGKTTAQIQEYQLKLIHAICRRVERAFI